MYDRDQLALAATDADVEYYRFRRLRSRGAAPPAVTYDYTVAQARYRFADAMITASKQQNTDTPL